MRRIEGFFEQVFEGSVGRLFRSPIQPAEIAKKLERAMEDNYVVGVDGVIVPNAYEVLFHPADLETFTAFRGTLVEEMEAWVREVAREERYRFVAPVSVRLASDEGVARRAIRVRASIVDVTPDEPIDDPLRRADVYTRDYRVIRTASGSPACRLKVLDGPLAGHVFIVGARQASIGRALDNDIVISTADVSRHHARLEQTGGGYRLMDLGSTNGSQVNAQRVAEQSLSAGDHVTIGGTTLLYQLGDELEASGSPPGAARRTKRGS